MNIFTVLFGLLFFGIAIIGLITLLVACIQNKWKLAGAIKSGVKKELQEEEGASALAGDVREKTG